jgi:hypothetical protein
VASGVVVTARWESFAGLVTPVVGRNSPRLQSLVARLRLLTFDDPKNYTKPFTVRIPHTLMADADIFEMFDENEKDCSHIRKPADAAGDRRSALEILFLGHRLKRLNHRD